MNAQTVAIRVVQKRHVLILLDPTNAIVLMVTIEMEPNASVRN